MDIKSLNDDEKFCISKANHDKSDKAFWTKNIDEVCEFILDREEWNGLRKTQKALQRRFSGSGFTNIFLKYIKEFNPYCCLSFKRHRVQSLIPQRRSLLFSTAGYCTFKDCPVKFRITMSDESTLLTTLKFNPSECRHSVKETRARPVKGLKRKILMESLKIIPPHRRHIQDLKSMDEEVFRSGNRDDAPTREVLRKIASEKNKLTKKFAEIESVDLQSQNKESSYTDGEMMSLQCEESKMENQNKENEMLYSLEMVECQCGVAESFSGLSSHLLHNLKKKHSNLSNCDSLHKIWYLKKNSSTEEATIMEETASKARETISSIQEDRNPYLDNVFKSITSAFSKMQSSQFEKAKVWTDGMLNQLMSGEWEDRLANIYSQTVEKKDVKRMKKKKTNLATSQSTTPLLPTTYTLYQTNSTLNPTKSPKLVSPSIISLSTPFISLSSSFSSSFSPTTSNIFLSTSTSSLSTSTSSLSTSTNFMSTPLPSTSAQYFVSSRDDYCEEVIALSNIPSSNHFNPLQEFHNQYQSWCD